MSGQSRNPNTNLEYCISMKKQYKIILNASTSSAREF